MSAMLAQMTTVLYSTADCSLWLYCGTKPSAIIFFYFYFLAYTSVASDEALVNNFFLHMHLCSVY